jgi:hypothetical protein
MVSKYAQCDVCKKMFTDKSLEKSIELASEHEAIPIKFDNFNPGYVFVFKDAGKTYPITYGVIISKENIDEEHERNYISYITSRYNLEMGEPGFINSGIKGSYIDKKQISNEDFSKIKRALEHNLWYKNDEIIRSNKENSPDSILIRNLLKGRDTSESLGLTNRLD